MMSMRCMVTLVDSVIAASSAERRSLIDDLVDSVNILPDRLTDHVAVAPLFLVTLQEVGLTRVVNPWCRRPDATSLLPPTGGSPDRARRPDATGIHLFTGGLALSSPDWFRWLGVTRLHLGTGPSR